MSYVKKCRKDCPDRKAGCHNGCARYAEDCEDARKRREYRQKYANLYDSIISQRTRQVMKAMRKHGKP